MALSWARYGQLQVLVVVQGPLVVEIFREEIDPGLEGVFIPDIGLKVDGIGSSSRGISTSSADLLL